MITFGFEIELNNVDVRLGGNNMPGGVPLGYLWDYTGGMPVWCYRVITDAPGVIELLPSQTFPNIRSPYPDIDQDTIFRPIRQFFNFLTARIPNVGDVLDFREFQARPAYQAHLELNHSVFDLGNNCSLEITNALRDDIEFAGGTRADQPCFIKRHGQINNILPQFTFGFDRDNRILERFYRRFVHVDGAGAALPTVAIDLGIFRNNPYSNAALNDFHDDHNMHAIWPLYDNRANAFRFVEFVRFYIAQTLTPITQANLDGIGHKYLCKIMSRTCFNRNIFWGDINLNAEQVGHVSDYIIRNYQHPLPPLILRPFQLEGTDHTSVYYSEMFGRGRAGHVNDTGLVQNIMNNNFTLESIVRSIFFADVFVERYNLHEWVNDEDNPLFNIFRNNLTNTHGFDDPEGDGMVTGERINDEIFRVARQINNYDFLSPVPYSPSQESMGLYSRPDLAGDERGDIAGIPQHLFEVRRGGEIQVGGNRLGNIFDNNFEQRCTDLFTQARNDFV